MNNKEEMELFAVFSRSSRFMEWLEWQEAEVVKTLKVADGTMLAKAQGKAIFIDEMKKLLVAAKSLQQK